MHNKAKSAWADENALGRAYAADVIAEIQAKEFPPKLGYVVKGMIARGQFGGFEVGFFNEIGSKL